MTAHARAQVVARRIHERQAAPSTAPMPNAPVAAPSPGPSIAPDDLVSLNSTGADTPINAFATSRIYTSLTGTTVRIGNVAATQHPSRCEGRRYTETGGAAPSLRRTMSQCDAPANPSHGFARRTIGNLAGASHGSRLVQQRSLVGRYPEAASPRARLNPDPQYRGDHPAGRSLPGRRSGNRHHPQSQSTATPIASTIPPDRS
jgi:hypothetical protein